MFVRKSISKLQWTADAGHASEINITGDYDINMVTIYMLQVTVDTPLADVSKMLDHDHFVIVTKVWQYCK